MSDFLTEEGALVNLATWPWTRRHFLLNGTTRVPTKHTAEVQELGPRVLYYMDIENRVRSFGGWPASLVEWEDLHRDR